LSTLLFSLAFSVSAQTKLKPTFKKIEFAYYDLNSPRTKEADKVELFSYASIDENGIVQIQRKRRDGVKYFVSELSDSIINRLNQVFNGQKLLREQMITHELKKGQHYAGYYSYLAYTSIDNKKDALCFIESLMSKKFNDVFYIIRDIVQKAENEIPAITKNEKKLYQSILYEHHKSTYLPMIELPPPADK
jgi:hypothetical protein